jgi:hypothetical protein
MMVVFGLVEILVVVAVPVLLGPAAAAMFLTVSKVTIASVLGK